MAGMVEAALALAERGFAVFPLAGKKPIEGGGFNTASTDTGRIEAWWAKYPARNIGIATGKVSRIVVLDIDSEEGEMFLRVNGYDSITDATLNVITGKGRHIYFAWPGRPMRNWAKRLPGIDFRGDGGYVVAPPSVHPDTGAIYEFVDEAAEIFEMPKWLIDICSGRVEPSDSRPSAASGPICEGQRNDILFKIGCRLRGDGMAHYQIEALLHAENAARCSPPLDRREVETIAKSASAYEPNEIPTPNYEKVAEMMEKSGFSETDIAKIRKKGEELHKAAIERISIDTLGIRMVHRSHGTGRGGRFDVTLSFNDQGVTLLDLSGAEVTNYPLVASKCREERFILPVSKKADQRWRELIEEAILSEQTPTVDRAMDEDVVSAIMAYTTEWLSTRREHETIEDAYLNKENGKFTSGDVVMFNGSALKAYLRRVVPDSSRKATTEAYRRLGISDKQVRIERSEGKDERVWFKTAPSTTTIAPSTDGE